MKNKVSIVIPIYNTSKFLVKCLDSVVNQTYHNLEIILVDDGSTDDSYQIAKRYAQRDKRIKLIHQENQGQSTARNQGLKKSTGSFISFIDSDDEITKDFVEKLLIPYQNNDGTALSVCGMHYKRLKSESTSDVYINSLRHRKSKESKKSYILYLLAIDGRMYSSVNKLYLADIARTCNFDTSLNFAEDTKFVLDYLKKASGELSFVLEPLYVYNFGTDTSTMHTVSTNWKNWQTSYKNLKNWVGKNPSLQEKFWLCLVHLRWRVSYFRSKRRAKKQN